MSAREWLVGHALKLAGRASLRASVLAEMSDASALRALALELRAAAELLDHVAWMLEREQWEAAQKRARAEQWRREWARGGLGTCPGGHRRGECPGDCGK